MDDFSKPKVTFVIKVLEHQTLTGADGEQHPEFDDCVNAVNGLIGWMARSLAETSETDRQRIGSEILIAALYSWTFNQHMDARDETDELSDEDLLDEDELDEEDEEFDEPDEDEPEDEYPPN